MSDLLDKIAAEMAEKVSAMVLAKIQPELESMMKSGMQICWLEDEAAALVHCSPQKLAQEAKDGIIDHTFNPAGRRVYMLHHLLDRLMRQEVKNGRQQVQLANMLPFKVEVSRSDQRKKIA